MTERKLTNCCFGVCCHLHQDCDRYAAIVNQTIKIRQATCDHGDGKHPDFVEKTDRAEWSEP